MKYTFETEDKEEGRRLVSADDTMLLVSAIADRMRDALRYEGDYTLEDAHVQLSAIVDDYWRG